MKTIIQLLTDKLAAKFGGKFTKSNQRSGRITIETWENEQLQIRATQPRNGPPGVRVSVRGEHLGELAKTDLGFAKLQFHIDLGKAIAEIVGSKYEVSFNDAPRGQGSSGYPQIFINRADGAQASQSTGEDTDTVVKAAVSAGVSKDDVLACIMAGDYTKLRGLTSLAVATGAPSQTPDDDDLVDADGDSNGFDDSNEP